MNQAPSDRVRELELQLAERERTIARLEAARRALIERAIAGEGKKSSGFGLFESNVMLARQVRERTRELEEINERLRGEERELKAAKEAAESAARARATFLTTMSHEIRTPLNGILGMAALLADTPLNGEQLGHLETIETCGRTLLQLIGDILDFSKLESRGLEAESIPFAPRDVAAEALSIVMEKGRAKGLRLAADIDPEVPRALIGDPGRLRQVLLNLLANAVKFTAAGHVLLKVGVQPGEGDGVFLECAVEDTGPGIAAEVQERLFQPFVQADASTTRHFGGTGLGLAICRQIVEHLGGTIGVTSAPGRGSRFWFRMPYVLSPAELVTQAARRRAFTLPRSAEGKRVLVVEDNVVNQRVAQALLHKLGAEVDVADNGAAAVEAVAAQEYDVVFMDCQMPVMDGLEASLKIRAWEAETGHERVAIVALTAHAFADDRLQCAAAGMDDYLTKPVSREDLARMIDRWAPKTAPVSAR